MYLSLLSNNKKILFLFLLTFLFNSTNVNSNINNSVIISVGNTPITYLDLVKEMRLISLLNNITVDNSNRETIKSVAVQGLINRRIKEIEIKKFKIENFNKKDLEGLIKRTSNNLGTDEKGLEQLLIKKKLKLKNIKERFEIDLKWNTLIFRLYNNKVVLNTNELENKIRTEIEKVNEKRVFLL